MLDDLLVCIFLWCQVAGALVVFEVQRSARSEAKKEEKRRQEMEVGNWYPVSDNNLTVI